MRHLIDKAENILAWALALAMFAIFHGILLAVAASAQTTGSQITINVPGGLTCNTTTNGQTNCVPVATPTPTPSPTPTSNPCDFTITSPASGVTVTPPVAITIQVNGTPPGGRWMNYYAGAYQYSGPVKNGSVNLPGPFINDWAAITAVELGPGVPASCKPQSVLVQVNSSPTPTPTPSSTPTPTPTPVAGELHPQNTAFNNTVPNADWLTSYKQGVANGLGGDKRGVELAGPWLQQVDGQHTGTTQDIVSFYATKYSKLTGIPIDPNWIMAELWQETQIFQGVNDKGQPVVGDIGNGTSLGVPQIKSADYWPTCPTVAKSQNINDINARDCMSHLSTPLAMDFFMNHIAGCLTGQMANYIHNGRDFGSDTSQHPGVTYVSYDMMVFQAKSAPAGSAANKFALYACSGQWYSGAYMNAGAKAYADFVQGYYNNPPWLNAAKAKAIPWPNLRNIRGY